MSQFEDHIEGSKDQSSPQGSSHQEPCPSDRERVRLSEEQFPLSGAFNRITAEAYSLLQSTGLEGVLGVGLLQQIHFRGQIVGSGYAPLKIRDDNSAYIFGSPKGGEPDSLARVELNLAYIGTEYGESQFRWAWAKNFRVDKQPSINEYQGRVIDRLSLWADAASELGYDFFNEKVAQKIAPWSGQSVGLQAAAALLGVNPTGTFVGFTFVRDGVGRVHYYLIEKDHMASPSGKGHFSNVHGDVDRPMLIALLREQNGAVFRSLYEQALALSGDPDFAHMVRVDTVNARNRVRMALLEILPVRSTSSDSVA